MEIKYRTGGTGTTIRRSRPGSTDGADRRKTPTEQAGQRGEAEKKYEVEIKREAGGANGKSRWDTDVVAAFAVEV